MGAYDNLIEWFQDCCLTFQEEPRIEVFEQLLKDYEKEIAIETCKRITNVHYGILKPLVHDDIVFSNKDLVRFNTHFNTDSIKIAIIKENENENKTKSDCTDTQNPAGASLSDTEG